MQKIAGTPSVIKQANQLLILELIQKQPGITKPELARATNLSLVTVSRAVDELVQSGQIAHSGYQPSNGGRKAKQYCINNNAGVIITILIRSGSYHITLCDIVGNVLREWTKRHAAARWTKELVGLIRQLLQHIKQEVLAIGVAVPGTVAHGVVSSIPLIHEWEGYGLADALARQFHTLIVVENDINASTIGLHENYTSSQVKNMLFLYLDDGIGASVVIGNKLYKSRRNFSGELSFMDIGRWEKERSATHSLEELVKQLLAEGRREELQDIVARLLLNTCCVLDPDLVVIDSTHLNQQDIDAIRQRFERLLGTGAYTPDIVVTQVGSLLYTKGLFSLCKSRMPAARIYT